MKTSLLTLLPIVLFGGLVLVAAMVLMRGEKAKELSSPLIGQPPPTFTLGDLSDRDLREKPTILNFFASWCAPCRVEHSQLSALSHRPDVQVIGIAYKDPKVRHYLAEIPAAFIKVGEDLDGRVSMKFGTTGVPETFILRSGIIVYRHVGPIMPEDLDRIILPILNGAAP